MSEFKPGDVCIGQNARRVPSRNGTECTVLHGLQWHDFMDPVTGQPIGQGGITYLIEWSDGHKCCAWPDQLRRKQLPQPNREVVGSWADCPWWPEKLTESL